MFLSFSKAAKLRLTKINVPELEAFLEVADNVEVYEIDDDVGVVGVGEVAEVGEVGGSATQGRSTQPEQLLRGELRGSFRWS